MIPQETRNKLDGLWDIRVYKKELDSDNFGKKPTSAASYINQDNRTAAIINKPATTKENQVKTSTSNTFFTEFQYMNQLVEVNECNMLVNTQLKEDRIHGTMPLTKVHKMNVIIRKGQMHSDLAQFLHGVSPQLKALLLKQ